jgi:uncharacterized protein (DUF302 family)
MNYGYIKKLHLDFETAEQRTREALAEEGFGVLSEIDVQAAFKNKLDIDYRPYKILGACNPRLARQAVDGEPHIGLLLPCNVLLQADTEGGGTLVSVADPRAMFQIVDNRDVQPVADEAAERLKRVVDAL